MQVRFWINIMIKYKMKDDEQILFIYIHVKYVCYSNL